MAVPAKRLTEQRRGCPAGPVWRELVDVAARRARLENPALQPAALLTALHFVHEGWGELALIRAAARLASEHYFDVEALCGLDLDEAALAWSRRWLDDVVLRAFDDLGYAACPVQHA